MRFYGKVSAFLTLTVVAFLLVGSSHELAQARSNDLVAARGGACLDCMETRPSACIANTCTMTQAGVWKKTTGMQIKGISCFNCASGDPGTDTCTNDTPKVCKSYRTCTAMGCPDASCGPESTDSIDTNCALTGYLCKGK